MHDLFALGERCPIETAEGLLFDNRMPPVIRIGIPRPSRNEVKGIRCGKLVHKFAANDKTAWMTLHFFCGSSLVFQGEVFHSAGKAPDNFNEEQLATWRDLPPNHGLACTLILVDTITQVIAALRLYAWSNALSLAFIDAAEKTRTVKPFEADQAANDLMQFSTDQLARMAKLTFVLPSNG